MEASHLSLYHLPPATWQEALPLCFYSVCVEGLLSCKAFDSFSIVLLIDGVDGFFHHVLVLTEDLELGGETV